MTRVDVPGPGGSRYELDDAVLDEDLARLRGEEAAAVRVAFAAAHVVMRPEYAAVPHSIDTPGDPRTIAEFVDFEATMGVRRRLAEHGLGIAEAMDTAQRFEIGWPLASRLIEGCCALDLAGGVVAGASSDHVPPPRERVALADAVAEQCRIIAQLGAVPVVLPMPSLCAFGATANEYVAVHARILERTEGPLILHWLGAMFAPALAGYFPGDSFDRVMDLDPSRFVACKLSLLDDEFELRVRRRLLPRGQFVMTGDDFHFGRLLLGGPIEGVTKLAGRQVPLGDFSHALLGVLDGVARPAARALRLIAAGHEDRARAVLTRCEAVGRHVFSEPTRHYKAGLALIAWLDGWQHTFLLPNHAERARSPDHHLRTAQLAAEAGVFRDAHFTAARLATLPH